MSYSEVVAELHSAAENWVQAVDEVATALSSLNELDPEEIPSHIRGDLALLKDGGFKTFVKKAMELEPDLSPPEELRELAQELLDSDE